MSHFLRFGAAAALISLLFTAAAYAQQANPAQAEQRPQKSVAQLEQESLQAYQDKQWVQMYLANMDLHKRRPYVPGYMLNITLAAAALDQKRSAYNYMLKMQQQGLYYDFNDYVETENIRGTEAYDYLNDLLVKAGDPIGEGSQFLELDLAPADLGDFAWDPGRNRFLVGTRSDGRLLAVDDQGRAEVLLEAGDENGLWSIDGLAVDEKNGRLWIASNATPVFERFTPADANRGALLEFNLETLEEIARFNVPVDALRHELGGVALTDDGHVYVVDRATPILYRKAPDGARLEAFAGGPHMVGLTDLAVTADNSRIFLVDAVLGILLIDPLAQRSAMLSGPENLNLSGIFNIEFVGKELIVTQSGISPQRIMRLELDPSGSQVTTVTPMASSLDGFDTPGVGDLRDGSIFYFANHGSPGAEKLLMMSTPLTAGNAVKPPDMRQFEEALRQRQQEAARQ